MNGLRTYTESELAALVPVPAADANKYTRGKLVAVVGSASYPGAACLAAAAAQRMGAGYVEAFTDAGAVPIVQSFRPSLVVRPRERFDGCEGRASSVKRPFACLVGSGFDASEEESNRLVFQALSTVEAPVIVDGGGLSALACEDGRRLLRERFERGLPTVVTPHEGEAARMASPLGCEANDRGQMARFLSLALGIVAVVKGPDTWISDGELIMRMAEGTPALATAGTGDVLAGMIGALLAQGLDAFDAAALGTTLHARAGNLAAERQGIVSVIAEDVIASLPSAIKALTVR